jgi:hypothetical protein
MTRDFYSEHVVKGRRPYYCAHCRQTILMGEQHVSVSSCSCGKFASHRSHIECHEAASGRPIDFAAGQQPERATVGADLPHEHVSAPAARGDSARNFPPDV